MFAPRLVRELGHVASLCIWTTRHGRANGGQMRLRRSGIDKWRNIQGHPAEQAACA